MTARSPLEALVRQHKRRQWGPAVGLLPSPRGTGDRRSSGSRDPGPRGRRAPAGRAVGGVAGGARVPPPLRLNVLP